MSGGGAELNGTYGASRPYSWKKRQLRDDMAGDHPFLVGRNYPHGHGTVGGLEYRGGKHVGIGVDGHPSPRQSLAYGLARGGIVLADAAREHQRVDAAHDGDQRARLAHGAPGEKRDRFMGARIATRP